MGMNNTTQAITREFRRELTERTKRIRRELVDELTERFRKDLVKIAATVTLDLDNFFSVEKMENEVRVSLQVKSND